MNTYLIGVAVTLTSVGLVALSRWGWLRYKRWRQSKKEPLVAFIGDDDDDPPFFIY